MGQTVVLHEDQKLTDYMYYSIVIFVGLVFWYDFQQCNIAWIVSLLAGYHCKRFFDNYSEVQQHRNQYVWPLNILWSKFKRTIVFYNYLNALAKLIFTWKKCSTKSRKRLSSTGEWRLKAHVSFLWIIFESIIIIIIIIIFIISKLC